MKEPAQKPWRLWRMDDNGNRFLIDAFTTESEAETKRAAYEALGHKQHYWVEYSSPD